ncbi:hypothetical protein V8E36_004362, partial [Tilletia maclaganii]
RHEFIYHFSWKKNCFDVSLFSAAVPSLWTESLSEGEDDLFDIDPTGGSGGRFQSLVCPMRHELGEDLATLAGRCPFGLTVVRFAVDGRHIQHLGPSFGIATRHDPDDRLLAAVFAFRCLCMAVVEREYPVGEMRVVRVDMDVLFHVGALGQVTLEDDRCHDRILDFGLDPRGGHRSRQEDGRLERWPACLPSRPSAVARVEYTVMVKDVML